MKIRCKQIYTSEGMVDGVLAIKDQKIEFVRESDLNTDYDLDMTNYRMIPGIIDIHTHGYHGCWAQSCDMDEILELSKKMATIGVTGFLLTSGEHNSDIFENLKTVKMAMTSQTTGARILGVHMEGPFLNPMKKGAFEFNQLKDLSIELMNEYLEAGGDSIKYVSLSPELDIDGKLIRFLIEKGIKVGGAHTMATYDEYTKAIAQGITASTHTGNAMRQIDRREVGALGAALLSDELYNEIICDFHHLTPEMIEIMFRVKTDASHYFIMVSDSGILSGSPAGTYEKNGQVRIVNDVGLIKLNDGTIAGSSSNVIRGIKNLEEQLARSMEEIGLLSALNPAKFLGLDDSIGSIMCGKDADFVIIDENYEVVCTFVKGVCVYDRNLI